MTSAPNSSWIRECVRCNAMQDEANEVKMKVKVKIEGRLMKAERSRVHDNPSVVEY